jgi:hypothetical protein
MSDELDRGQDSLETDVAGTDRSNPTPAAPRTALSASQTTLTMMMGGLAGRGID